MKKNKRQQLDEILEYAAERGIDVPGNILLDVAEKDSIKVVSDFKIPADSMPIFTKNKPGAVPPYKKDELLILSNGGWTPPMMETRYIGMGGGTTAAAAPGGEAFPVGSVFMSTVATDPNLLLGYGVWQRIAEGRVIVGLDAGDSDFDTVTMIGGDKTVASSGTVAAPVFTGLALANHSHGAGTYSLDSVSGGTPAGTNDSISGGTPAGTISYPVNVPTFTGSGLAGHTHTFAGSALAGHTHTFAGTASVATSGASAGATQRGATASTLTLAVHTHNFTSAGTNSSVSGGTPAGTNDSVSGGTPAGTVAWPVNPPTFGGNALAGHTHTFAGSALAGHAHTISNASEAVTAGTPAGTNAAPAYTGAATSIIQPYFVAYIWERTA